MPDALSPYNTWILIDLQGATRIHSVDATKVVCYNGPMPQEQNPYEAPQQMRTRRVNRELFRLRVFFVLSFVLVPAVILLAQFAAFLGLWKGWRQ
jgi:hypothetical protein